MKKCTLFLGVFIGGCYIPKPSMFNPPCTKENLLIQFKNRYSDVDWNNKNILFEENDSVFRLMYVPKNIMTRDGVGSVEVSKKDCKIISERFY